MLNVFQGYTDETFEFFMAIRFNNNRPFFLENRDWYLRAVREPSLALAEAIAPAVEKLDAELERRPHRVVSRINRDVRFSRDKSPYRDYIWLAFRRPGEARDTTLGVYFDLSDNGASYGMGFYRENRDMMNALRERMRTAPEELLSLYRPLRDTFALHVNAYKRMRLPEDLPTELHDWYAARGFYLEREIDDFDLLRSPALAEEIRTGYARLAPLYRYLLNLQPEGD